MISSTKGSKSAITVVKRDKMSCEDQLQRPSESNRKSSPIEFTKPCNPDPNCPLQKLRERLKIRQDSQLLCLLFKSVGKGEREDIDTHASLSTIR